MAAGSVAYVVEIMSSLVSNLFSIAVSVVLFIAWWKIFNKAGEKGWKALIPFYNAYTMCKIVGKKKAFILFVIGAAIEILTIFAMCIAFVGICAFTSYGSERGAMLIFAIVLAYIGIILGVIFMGVMNIIVYVYLVEYFDLNKGFIAGLILLNPVFIMIIACNSDIQWVGPHFD